MEVVLQRLSDYPEISPLCDDRHRFCALRRYPYSIIYRVESGNVLVVAVAHAHCLPTFWTRRG
jgi:plasmid stabilization system protein ParE